VQAFGKGLFKSLLSEGVQPLLGGLAKTPISLGVLSNRPDVQAIPWEYLQEPSQAFGPNVDRSVVRIRAHGGSAPLQARRARTEMWILFVSAAPIDQGPVSWVDVKDAIERPIDLFIRGHGYGGAVEGGCQAITVSGLTRTRLSFRPVQRRRTKAQRARSQCESGRRAGLARLRTRSWCLRARISAARATRALGARWQRAATGTGSFSVDHRLPAVGHDTVDAESTR
jgi:hypothetical protein